MYPYLYHLSEYITKSNRHRFQILFLISQKLTANRLLENPQVSLLY